MRGVAGLFALPCGTSSYGVTVLHVHGPYAVVVFVIARACRLVERHGLTVKEIGRGKRLS